jgi:hypothetical protein
MTKNIIASFGLFFTFSVGACSSGSAGPAAPDPAPGGVRQQLVVKGDCTFEACGVPSSFEGEAKIECAPSTNDTCEWSADGDSGSVVGYAYCQDSECPPRPAIDCPADTVRSSQQCGNENNAGCAWTTVCVPPRETTPCPAQNGCDDQPRFAIGILCSDGSTGDFVCVTDDQKCFWERNCD